MRPLTLEFCGINSFSEPAKIDFTSLADCGIFGIFGDTGSGKSTILDCIGLALYGSTLRSRTGVLEDIINNRQNAAYVRFEFEILYEGERRIFRVERELKRRSSALAHRAIVYERRGDTLTAVAEGPAECTALFEQRVIGLEQKDFDRCIALPQGEFSQFVKSRPGERLKLVSRLFDLERYGERLAASAREEVRKAEAKQRELGIRLERYAGVSEEGNRALGERVKELRERSEEAARAAERANAGEREMARLCEAKRGAEEAARALAALEEKREEIEELERELSRLDKAALVLGTVQDGKRLKRALDEAEEAFRGAKQRRDLVAERALTLAGWDASAAQEEIDRLTERRAAALSAEGVRARKARAEQELRNAIAAQAEEAKLFPAFDYEARRSELRGKLEACGGERLFSAGKAALLRAEYAEFARELRLLAEQSPLFAEAAAPLIRKYTLLSEGEKLDFDEFCREFEALEGKRKQLNEALLSLEAQKGKYDRHLALLGQYAESFSRLKEDIASCEAQLADLPDLKETEQALRQKREEKQRNSEQKAAAEAALAAAETALAKAEAVKCGAETAYQEGKSRFESALRAGGFESPEEAVALAKKYGDPKAAAERARTFRNDLAAWRARKQSFEETDFSQASEEALAECRRALGEANEAVRECARQLALAEAEWEKGRGELEIKRGLEREFSAAEREYSLRESLKKLLDGNKFMEYVAEEYLQTVALNASGRLLTLTDGRYFLRYEGGFAVGDNFNGGEMRGVHTLSGGETFLVSLSLALALSAEICARSLRPIEFFFLDEGFGTLDAHLVDTVMDSLEKLKNEHLTIGVISHVSELKHRIDRKLLVVKATEERGSQIISD